MEPKVQAHDDGTLTISITLPAASDAVSMLAQEERLMEAINAVGRVGAAHLLAGFDAHGQPLLHAGRKWTSKGRVAKCYETPWGEVILDRHLDSAQRRRDDALPAGGAGAHRRRVGHPASGPLFGP